MNTLSPAEASTWTLRDLRRALAAGWAPEWVASSGWWPALRRHFLAQPELTRVVEGRHEFVGYAITVVPVAELMAAVDQRIASAGARAPAWLPRSQKKGRGATAPAEEGANNSPGQSAGAGANNPGGNAPEEQRHADLKEAPSAGTTDRSDRTSQDAPPRVDPASREGGEPSARAGGAPQAGERTAKSGEVGCAAQGTPLVEQQKARGGTEADLLGATQAVTAHDQAQETPETAGLATAPVVEGEDHETSSGATGAAVYRLHTGGREFARLANGAARAPGESPTDEVTDEDDLTKHSGGGPSRTRPCSTRANVTATWAGGLERSRREVHGARKLGRELERWMRRLDAGAMGDPSPRIDGEKLITELVSRRYAVSRARRWEREPGLIVVLIDVSGSCSVAAPGTIAAARAFAAAHPGRVAALVHTNGWVVEAHGAAASWSPPPTDKDKTCAWVLRHAGASLAGAVAFGDWDAGDVYEALAQLAPLIWLDSYNARHGVAPASKQHRAPWSAPKMPVVWMQGVQTAAQAAEAVRQAR